MGRPFCLIIIVLPVICMQLSSFFALPDWLVGIFWRTDDGKT